MNLNQFIDTGADDATVNDMKKSIAREDDLQKAMNKAGLVQKEVQVKGKNGQIFTRKQWVKSSDAQNTANNSPQQSIGNNPSQMSQKDESKSPKAISVSSFNGKSYTEIVKLLDDAPPGTKISGIIDPGGQKRFNHNRDVVIEKHSGYVANYSVGAKSKETWWEFNGSKKPDVAGEILDIVKGKSKYYQVRNDDSQLTKLGGRFKREDFKLPKSGNMGNADELLSMVNKLDESCSVVGIRPEVTTGHGIFTIKTYKITSKPGDELKVRYGSDAQGVYFKVDGEEYRDVNSLVEHIKSSGSTTDKSSSTSKKDKQTSSTSTDDVSKKVDDLVKQYSKADYDMQAAKFSHDANAETRARSRRTEAQKKLKELGYKPQKSKDVKGLFTAQKIENSTLKDKSSGEQSGQKNDQGKMNHQTGVREKKAATMIEDYFAGNHSHDDGKKALANLLGKGYTRDDIMAQAEKSGVTWKKNDHAGINWMRASMAIQKHLNNSSK